MSVFDSVSYLLVTHKVWLIMQYFGAPLPMVVCFPSYMLMTWLLRKWSYRFCISEAASSIWVWNERFSFLRYFLGTEVAYSSRGYLLSQQKYIANHLDHATLSDPATPTSSSVSTPLELHLKLRRDDDTQPTWYQELVESLVYLSATRPDISYAIHVLGQFGSAPTSVHYATLFRVRYL